MPEFRCTRNTPYAHDCIGYEDLTVRQGYYLQADNAEEAWEKMAARFPEETRLGFTVQEWKSFNVTVIQVKRDQDGNIIN